MGWPHREQARSHSDLGNAADVQTATNPVGASLLAMAVAQAIQGEWAGLIAGKPGSLSDLGNGTDIQAATKPVGASLLAMAVGQAIHLVNGPASSRASPAPTVICVTPQIFRQPQNLICTQKVGHQS